MINYYRTRLDEQLAIASKRGLLKPLSEKLPSWVSAPDATKPSRRNAGRAIFAPSIVRRRGYLISMSPSTYLNLVGLPVMTDEIRLALEERWQRCLIWKPLRLILVPNQGGWKVLKPSREDARVAQFMADKDQGFIRVHGFHEEDAPATKECLTDIISNGLFTRFNDDRYTIEWATIAL